MLTKTRRYWSYINLKLIPIVTLWILNLSYEAFNLAYKFISVKWFHLTFLKKNLWHFTSNLLFKNQGLLPNTLTKSYDFWSLNIQSIYFFNKCTRSIYFDHTNINYLYSVPLINISFSKKYFRKNIIHILYFLVSTYISYRNLFVISYNFLLIFSNFNIIPFYNIFYFKIHRF